MTWSFVAVCGVLALSFQGPAVLRRATRACGPGPRGELVLWMVATSAWLASCAALVWMFAAELLGPSVKGVIAACLSVLQALERNGAGVGIGVALFLALLAAARLTWTGLRRRRAGLVWKRGHHRGLRSEAVLRVLYGRPVWLVDSVRRSAYCVPGSQGGIVLTTGTLAALSPLQARAVLEHEKAHLEGRHHLMVSWVRLLDSAFPGVPLLRAAVERVPVLVEWAADDRAVRVVGPGPLVHALGKLAGAEKHDTEQSLAISGACPIERVRRQVTQRDACPKGSAAVRTVLAAMVVTAPLWFTVAATIANMVVPHCDCAV